MTVALVDRLGRLELPDELVGRLGARSSSLRLHRSWPRDAGHLLVEYRDAEGTTIVGQWFGSDGGEADRGRLRRAGRETAAVWGRGAPVGILPDHGLLLQARGADRRLRPLARLASRPGAALISHRPEGRGVVRFLHQGSIRYAKVLAPDRTAALIRRYVLASARTRVPRLIEHKVASGVTVWSEAPGRSLYELLGQAGLSRYARLVGRALRSLHDGQRCWCLPEHDAGAEQRVLTAWLGRLEAFASHRVPPGWVTRRVRELLEEPASAARLIHRDFYDRQAVIDAFGQVALIDLDTLALGEPALDLANALVHLELRVLQGRCRARTAAEAATALMEGYGPDPGTQLRLPAYAAASRLRLYCVYSFRPAWHSCTEGLLERLEAPLLTAPLSRAPDPGPRPDKACRGGMDE